MKKIILALVLSVSTFALTGNANANTGNMDFKPYVGLDYAHTRNAGGGMYVNSPYLNVGTMFGKYFGTEAFYQHSYRYKDTSTGVGQKYRGYLQGYGLDINGYLPITIDCENRLALIGSLGIADYRINYKVSDATSKVSARENGLGWRFGAGFLVNVNENVAVRAMYRHIEINKMPDVDHFHEYALGVRYSF